MVSHFICFTQKLHTEFLTFDEMKMCSSCMQDKYNSPMRRLLILCRLLAVGGAARPGSMSSSERAAVIGKLHLHVMRWYCSRLEETSAEANPRTAPDPEARVMRSAAAPCRALSYMQRFVSASDAERRQIQAASDAGEPGSFFGGPPLPPSKLRAAYLEMRREYCEWHAERATEAEACTSGEVLQVSKTGQGWPPACVFLPNHLWLCVPSLVLSRVIR